MGEFIENNLDIFYWLTVIMLAVATLVILAFLGDFAQSFLKRKSNIKNSSNLIPGHGGLFDRMDGYLMGSFLLPFQEIIL